MSGKVFKPEKIAQCVQILDELAASGLGTQAFAQARGLSYTQLRAWQNHEARWRARLAGIEAPKPVPPGVRTSGFLRVHSVNAARPADRPQQQGPTIRIDCSHGSRSASVHWPLEAGVPCAQWLAVYLAC